MRGLRIPMKNREVCTGNLKWKMPDVSYGRYGRIFNLYKALVHNLEQVLGVGQEKEGCEAVVTEVPENELVTWCTDNSPRAPAIIAKLVPVFKNKEEAKWHPLAQRLIDEFGDLEEVRSRLSMNLWSFSSWGSRAPYYERRIQLLKTILKHRCKEVRTWATMEIEGFEKDREEAQMKAEEWEWGIH